MKISLPSGLLEIPQDLEFEIKASHPFFSDEGSASIPVTIPATVPNCALLDYPERVDRMTRYQRESSAIAECGAWRKQCKVITESAGKGAGISMCLALAESEMYAEAQDRKLKDLFSRFTFAQTRNTPQSTTDVYHGWHDLSGYYGDMPSVAFFPVASDGANGSFYILNKVSGEHLVAPGGNVPIGDKTVSVETGYGLAPYIYLGSMIDFAFREAGFGIGANPFLDDEDLKNIVVVHNRADVCLGSVPSNDDYAGVWLVDFADLVPDITLGDLIVWLHDKFGAVVRSDSGGIYIYLMRDLLTGDPDYDLTPLLVNDETLSYPAPSTIERSVDTSINSAQPAAESLELLREKHPNCTEVTKVANIAGSGLFHVTPLGKYYYKTASAATPTLLGSSSFPYKRKSDLKADSISTDDCFIPSVEVDGVIMPYIGERTHVKVETDQEKKEQPLQICYAHDVLQSDGTTDCCGSSFSYDSTGLAITKRIRQPNGSIALTPHPALTPEGLAPFWAGYEKMLLNGAPEISLECEFPMADLVTINMVTPKMFKGAHVLIKEITYKVTDAATTRAKLTLQLIPVYNDMVTPASVYFNRNIGWKRVSTRTLFPGGDYTVDATDGLSDYLDEQHPQYTPRTSGIVTMKRSRWVRYKHKFWTVKWYMISYNVETVTHRWEEYFISEAQ